MRWAVVFLVLVACGGQPPTPAALPREPWSGSWSPPPAAKDDPLIAEVGEQKIYQSDVVRLATASKKTPRQATEDLIGQALLADEARRRGLLDDPEVQEAVRNARARALIDHDFATRFKSAADVPMSDVEKLWANDPRIKQHFDHPEVRIVHYYRYKAKTPAEYDRAKEAIDALAADIAARPLTSEQDLVARGDRIRDERQLEAEESPIWTTQRGRTVPVFADACFAIARIGEVSPPFRTDWGWDIVYLKEIDPERHLTMQQAAPEIREKIFDASRARAFAAWADGLVKQHQVVRHDERLADITVDSPLTPPPGAP